MQGNSLTDVEDADLYRGDWAVHGDGGLEVEGEVVRVYEDGRVKLVVGGWKELVVEEDNCRLHEQGRPELRREEFERFD